MRRIGRVFSFFIIPVHTPLLSIAFYRDILVDRNFYFYFFGFSYITRPHVRMIRLAADQ